MAESARAAEPPFREKDEPLPRRAPGRTIPREDIVQAVAQNTANSLKDTVTAVREQMLRVLVTFDPASAERVALCCQNGRRTHCIVQPENGPYLPAVLTPDASSPGPAPAYLLIIYLAAGEADMLFPPGHRFTIWADVLVGQTPQGKGLIGHGTAREQDPPTP
jgi:hypothetical protein